jgi:hypothetical protein
MLTGPKNWLHRAAGIPRNQRSMPARMNYKEPKSAVRKAWDKTVLPLERWQVA